ncbi:MAG: serine/threonine-protein kinase [Planctomycetaceae bacterium]
MKCPPPEILKSLEIGTATSPDLDLLLEHVNDCEICQRHFSDQDDFLSDLDDSEIAAALTLHSYSKEEKCQEFIDSSIRNQINSCTSDFPEGLNANSLVGKTIDGFTLTRIIARGGMGVVYEAEQVALHRQVALKLISSFLDHSDQEMQRFRNESLAAARLDHPHIVPIYQVGESAGHRYLVMKLIVGQNLAEFIQWLTISRDEPEGHQDAESIKERPWLSEKPSVNQIQFLNLILKQYQNIAESLQYAHERGIVHRDIKPSNLLLDQTGKLWLSDFGIAKWDHGDNLTITGAVVGTPRYMSPEQASGSGYLVDHRSDIYSLGASLYELLTLRPLFAPQKTEDIYHCISHRQPVPPREYNPALPHDVETILLKTLSKRPEDRYQTASELADDLERYLDGSPIKARRLSMFERSSRWFLRHRAVTAGLLFSSLVILAAMAIISTTLIVTSKKQQELLRLAERSQELLQKSNYFSKIREASTALKEGDALQLERILSSLKPEEGEHDFRRGEWYYLNNQLHQANELFLDTPEAIYAFAFS